MVSVERLTGDVRRLGLREACTQWPLFSISAGRLLLLLNVVSGYSNEKGKHVKSKLEGFRRPFEFESGHGAFKPRSFANSATR
jgi:hypothetical protein